MIKLKNTQKIFLLDKSRITKKKKMWKMVYTFISTVLVSPWTFVYLNGPQIYGHGFHQGAPMEEVCFSLTQVPATFWLQSPQHLDECREVVDRHVLGWTIGFYLLFLLGVFYRIFQWHLYRQFVIQPLLLHLQAHTDAQARAQAQAQAEIFRCLSIKNDGSAGYGYVLQNTEGNAECQPGDGSRALYKPHG
jgi:hypothetical protein